VISPHATVPRQDRLKRVLLFLEAQFGDAITPLSDGIEIRVDDNEAHMAKLDFETMEVECKWEPLGSRVKHIVKRALGVVAPLGVGGVVKEEEDFMAEMEGLVDTVIKIEGNGVDKMEDDT
jgi:Pre-mRNA 3'-end-processing endonuclease polyadenylation factor C-term